MQNLVIVESPTKARMLSKYLGDKYQVEASMGHMRDLPKSELGIDVDNNFEPKYIVPRDKIKKVNELKKLVKGAKYLWLATDPDREGEAIAWHLRYLLTEGKGSSDILTKRVVFHEITEGAIKEAFADPREVDLRLVDAQQARRILDRLVGYKLSPLLWKKVKSGLSAGRVQSVALRLIVEREQEINAFKADEYWSLEAELETTSPAEKFIATLIAVNDKKVEINNGVRANELVADLQKAKYQVANVTNKEVRKYSAPPFTTSTLQQACSNRLGMSAKKTMMIAQALYEHGLITYMRTDSVNLSSQAIDGARSYIAQNIGSAYLPKSAKVYKTKSKVAQEAHEAIRPTNVNLTSEKLKTADGVSRDHVRVYELIWKRMLASQMSEAVMDSTTVDVMATTDYRLPTTAEDGKPKSDSYLFRATGSVIKFDGWLKLYGKTVDETEEEDGEKSQALPKLVPDESLTLLQLLPKQHFTEAPPRFNEASLIKKLEELGIGRPSTYAPTLSTIQDRFYVEKREKKFFPTSLGIAVIKFLMQYFADLFDYAFTAEMEDSLDAIACGEKKWQPTIASFYEPFAKKLLQVDEGAERVKIEVETTDQDCPECGKKLVIKFGRFGKFLACSGFPDCKHTESFEQKINVICPDCGGEIVFRKTRKGRTFYGCKNWPTCKFASWTKPKNQSEQKPPLTELPR